MKIRKNTFNKKPLIIILAIVAIFIIGSGVTYTLVQPWNQETKSNQEVINDVDYNNATQDQIDNGADIKEDAINNDTKTPPAKDTLTLTVSSFKKDPSTYRIGIDIAQIVSSGECKIVLTSPGKQDKTYTSDIQALPGYSTCKGFDIPLGELENLDWTVQANVMSGSATGTAKAEITL